MIDKVSSRNWKYGIYNVRIWILLRYNLIKYATNIFVHNYRLPDLHEIFTLILFAPEIWS